MLNVYNLDKAVAEFDNWVGAACIFLDLRDGEVVTEVYFNDLSDSELSGECYYCLDSKDEVHGRDKFGTNGHEHLKFVIDHGVENYLGRVYSFKDDYMRELYQFGLWL